MSDVMIHYLFSCNKLFAPPLQNKVLCKKLYIRWNLFEIGQKYYNIDVAYCIIETRMNGFYRHHCL